MSILSFLLLSFILLLTKTITSVDIHCRYEIGNNTDSSNIYKCDVENQLNIISKKFAKIKSAKGAHEVNKTNDDVTCFYAHDKNLQIFPRGLQTIFRNLKKIGIYIGCLKEINQKDLKVFPQLEELDLWSNDIRVLEDNIFDYNPNLTYINLSLNKLIMIGTNVFNIRINLTFLGLASNPCISRTALNDSKAIMKILAQIKTFCISAEFLRIQQELSDLKEDYKDIEIDEIPAFKAKVDAFQAKFKKSSLLDIPSIKERIQQLPSSRDQTLWNLREQLKNRKSTERIKWIALSFSLLNQIIMLIVIYIIFVYDIEDINLSDFGVFFDSEERVEFMNVRESFL